MSYILDALKKADAERERGAVPGLHSQPLGQVEDDDDDEGGKRTALPPVAWLAAGVGLCLIAVLSWQLLKKDEPAVVAVADQSAAPLQAIPQQMPPQQVTPETHGMQTPASPPAQQVPPMAQGMPAPPPGQRMGQPPGGFGGQRGDMPPPLSSRPGKPFGGEQAAREKPPAAPATTTATGTTKPASPHAASAGERVPTASELPDDVRQSLPQLVIGGAMYSDTPATRMLIVNSQVFHEGDQPYQGLVLEEIRLKSAVFRYRGYRYAVNY